MKLTLSDLAKSKWSIAGLISAIVILPNLGKGLTALSWLVGAPAAAYAGKETAEHVDERFERYIESQDAVTQALNNYVQHQAQQQLPMDPPAPEAQWWTAEDAKGCWECWGYSLDDCDRNQRWARCAE